MYEPAARTEGPPAPLWPAPLWYVGEGHAVFAGPLHYNAPHSHSVPVLVAGMYERFGLRIAGGLWSHCRCAVIPAGLTYELDVGGQPLAVVYLEPTVAGVEALLPLVAGGETMGAAVVGPGGEIGPLRELYENPTSVAWAGAALGDLLGFTVRRAGRAPDARILSVVAAMASNYEDLEPVGEVARSVGLSVSRFQHLFAREVGVPFRRYRSWHRLRGAIREITAGSNFTTAAHASGFSDQAHFARDFRRTFGAPASPSLRHVRKAPGRRLSR